MEASSPALMPSSHRETECSFVIPELPLTRRREPRSKTPIAPFGTRDFCRLPSGRACRHPRVKLPNGNDFGHGITANKNLLRVGSLSPLAQCLDGAIEINCVPEHDRRDDLVLGIVMGSHATSHRTEGESLALFFAVCYGKAMLTSVEKSGRSHHGVVLHSINKINSVSNGNLL